MAVSNFYDSFNMQKLEGTEMFIKLERKLRENRWYKPMLDNAEVSWNVNRVYIVSGGALVLFGLLLQYGVLLITSAVGFMYPLYKTFQILKEKPSSPAEKKWLVYWLIHAALNFAETFFFFWQWVPGYWIWKCCFLYWCYAPLETSGSDIVYGCMIHPFLQTNQEMIDNTFHQVVSTAAARSNVFGDFLLEPKNMQVSLMHPHQN